MSKSRNKIFVSELFQRYELKLRKILMRKSSHKDNAEDILQETFLRAHRVPDWQNVENPEAYLISIAKNAYYDHTRKEIRHETDHILMNEVEGNMPTPEELFSRSQQIENIKQVVNSLTPRVRQAMIFIKIMELSYAETCGIMKISRSTLKNHITIGMVECRKKIGVPMELPDVNPEAGKIISLNEHKQSKKEKLNMSREL